MNPPGQSPYPAGQSPYLAGQSPYPAGQSPYPLQDPFAGTTPMYGFGIPLIPQPPDGPRGDLVNYSNITSFITCQFCGGQVYTKLRYKSGLLTWLLCAGICILGCPLGCCLIPFCVDAGKIIVHSCPRCHRDVGMDKDL